MIYHYFGSKENLYVEVLRYNYNKIYTLSKNAINFADDPRTNVARAIRAYFYYLAENEAHVRLTSWEALCGGRCAGKVFPKFFDLIELEFDDIIKNGIVRGFIRPAIDIRQVILTCTPYAWFILPGMKSFNPSGMKICSQMKCLKHFWSIF